MAQRCAAGACTPAAAALSDCDISENTARLAGGGIYYAGAGATNSSSLALSACRLADNVAIWTVNGSADAVGGGLFLGRSNFSVVGVAFEGNSAYYGGGLFVSADMAPAAGATLAVLNLTNNRAVVGPAAYW